MEHHAGTRHTPMVSVRQDTDRKLGIVIRSSDGSKKGIDIDSFVKVTDHKYQGFSPAEIKHAALPGNVEEGINVINNTTVTLVLYDKDTEGNHKDFAHVLGDFNNWELTNKEDCQMCRDDAAGCWWITLNNLNPTKEYAFQYYVGTKGGEVIRLADAYCEKILDPGHDDDIPASTYPDNKDTQKAEKELFRYSRYNETTMPGVYPISRCNIPNNRSFTKCTCAISLPTIVSVAPCRNWIT